MSENKRASERGPAERSDEVNGLGETGGDDDKTAGSEAVSKGREDELVPNEPVLSRLEPGGAGLVRLAPAGMLGVGVYHWSC